MVTYSTGLRTELQVTGENSGTWGTITNNNFSQVFEFAIAGVVNVACGDAAVTTLTNADGPQTQANNQARNKHIRLTGSHSAVRIAQFPATQKVYLISNATTDAGSSGPYAMTCRLGATGNTVSIENGATRVVSTDGTNWYDVFAVMGSITTDGVDLDGGELVMDADGDTSLTADNDDQIDLKIATIDVAEITTANSGDLVITTAVQDKDFTIIGDDGGSPVTALTLDMSDAGAATFSGVVTSAGLTIGSAVISEAELETIDGVTAGTVTLSKALIVDANKDLTGLNDIRMDSLGVATAASGTSGEIRATNDVTAFYSSDVALKENIVKIPSPMEMVKKINGCYFDWKDSFIKSKGGEDGYFVRKKDVGILAQDVEKVLPEIVATRQDGIKAVKYDRLVSLLVECVKDLQGQVDKLKGK
jgi:hypothetical protein